MTRRQMNFWMTLIMAALLLGGCLAADAEAAPPQDSGAWVLVVVCLLCLFTLGLYAWAGEKRRRG